MALYIRTGVIGEVSDARWTSWHVGRHIPPLANNSRVLTFQADGDELEIILRAMRETRPQIPCQWEDGCFVDRNDVRVVRWSDSTGQAMKVVCTFHMHNLIERLVIDGFDNISINSHPMSTPTSEMEVNGGS